VASTNNYPLAFWTSNAGTFAERMRIDSSGRVGIGWTPSGSDGIFTVIINSIGFYLGYGANYDNYYTAGPSGIQVFRNANTERMRIDSSGNLCLGTTATLGAKFGVYGTGSGSNNYIQITNPGIGTACIGVQGTSSNVKIYNSYASGTLATGAGIDIDTSGRVLVNITSDVIGNNPAFIVNGTGFSNGSEFRWTGTGSFYNVMVANGNGFLGGINTSGSTTSYVNLSDYRVKENINPMVNALDKIALLKPCTFTYKTDGIDGQGFIAHELQEVFPDAVVGEKDAVDAEGKPVYQGVDTSFLVATLTAAIQEQQALIQDLTTRLAALEAK